MKHYRIVRVERKRNPSGRIGFRRKPIGANANSLEQAESIRDELIRLLGGNYEVQEREMPLIEGLSLGRV